MKQDELTCQFTCHELLHNELTSRFACHKQDELARQFTDMNQNPADYDSLPDLFLLELHGVLVSRPSR